MRITDNKILVEIWIDINCPFCYLGKKIFEKALSQFSNKENVEVIWRSFQLKPDLHSIFQLNELLVQNEEFYLKNSDIYNLIRIAGKEQGLIFNFQSVKPTNTVDAHRLLYFSKGYGRQENVLDDLFKAYFSNGKNINDYIVLHNIGIKNYLDQDKLMIALMSGSYSKEVRSDIDEARKLNIMNIPFFLINRKYAIIGIHEPSLFIKVFEKFLLKRNSIINNGKIICIANGGSCSMM